MRLDSVTAEIRPRSDWEAVDLGFAMARRDFWRSIAVWWLALGVPTLVAGIWLWDHPLLLLILFWWLKPAGSRMVLFGLSRRLFGELPGWRTLLREIPRAWTRRFFYRFIWARFSPWLPVTLAVEDLEGLRGDSYHRRCGQLIRRGEGVTMWLYLISDTAAAWLGVAILALVMMLVPDGQDAAWRQAVESWDPELPLEIPLLVTRTVVACVMLGISLTDVFVTGAGFGVYINNRTWIEGWDVELAFKRLAQRLGNLAVAAMLAFFLLSPAGQAEPIRKPAEVIQEVKADEAFRIHSVTDRVPKPSKSNTAQLPLELVEGVTRIFVICAIVASAAFLGWMLWKNRHAFKWRGMGLREPPTGRSARVVMGMDLSPDTLPADIPGAAWALWLEGRHQQALGLLYRGSISRIVEIGRVEIEESDTEGDCLRRVQQGGAALHPEYFQDLTGIWIRQAYAGQQAADSEVRGLCGRWPFGERRGA